MFAPDLIKILLILIFCLSDIPSGYDNNADPPPEIKNMIKSFFVVLDRNLIRIFDAERLCAFGIGCPDLKNLNFLFV